MSKENIYKNALITQTISKLNTKDKQEIITTLLQNKTERQLAKELNIPKSTIHDWRTLRQDNTGENIHVSLSAIYRKLKTLKPQDITDWGRIIQINEVTEELIKRKPTSSK